MPNRITDITGQRFGMLVAIQYVGSNNAGDAFWLCHCDCGKLHTVSGRHLRGERSKSCGCQQGFHRHGYARKNKEHPLYRVWIDMRRRCNDSKREAFERYGGRGIKICERWNDDFALFVADVGERPGPEFSLDRYPDNDGNYEPGNVRWATKKEQANNRRPRRKLKN